MRLLLGPPPNSLSDTDLNSGEWHRLKHPPLWVILLLSLPMSALLALIMLMPWVALTPRFEISSAPTSEILVACLLVLLTGLWLQLLPHPGRGMSRQSILGFWPKWVTPYTAYEGKLPKRRMIASLILPTVVLSIFPLIIAASLQLNSGWLAFGSCLAAATFGMNVFLAILMACKIPKGAVVAGRGYQAYWRAAL